MADKKKPPTEKKKGVGKHGNLQPRPPWKPGESGNPKGKPLGVKNRSTIYRQFFELVLKDDKGGLLTAAFGNEIAKLGMTVEQALVMKHLQMALKGDIGAIEKAFDSVYGKSKETHEITGLDGGPIQSEAKVEDARQPLTVEEARMAYMHVIKGA